MPSSLARLGRAGGIRRLRTWPGSWIPQPGNCFLELGLLPTGQPEGLLDKPLDGTGLGSVHK